MSKRRRKHGKRVRLCSESGQPKRIYQTPGEAYGTAARVLAHRGNRSATALRAYHCPKCKGWHLTKQLHE